MCNGGRSRSGECTRSGQVCAFEYVNSVDIQQQQDQQLVRRERFWVRVGARVRVNISVLSKVSWYDWHYFRVRFANV